jgi:septum formation protein
VRPLSILLASASPRRRSLLELLGHRVLVQAVSVDESERADEDAGGYVRRVVDAKLAAALAAAPRPTIGLGWDALVVADTVVALDGALLHKPLDTDDGRRMLRALSGRAHEVTTRFALANAAGDTHVESVSTRVVFRALSADEVEWYLRTGEGEDKAGGYGIQGIAGAFISRIEGSYGAVVGLPLAEVSVALARLCP